MKLHKQVYCDELFDRETRSVRNGL